MALDKIVDSAQLDGALSATASAIRAKTGGTEQIPWDAATGFAAAVSAITAGGGGNTVQIGQNTKTPNILNLFWVLENGTAKTGEFTLASSLPNKETLIFDSGLSTIKGIFYVDADYVYTATDNKPEYGVWGLYMKNTEGKNNVQAIGLSTYNAASTILGYVTAHNTFITRATYEIIGGALYVTATYNNHQEYTPFCPNHRYVWVAW